MKITRSPFVLAFTLLAFLAACSSAPQVQKPPVVQAPPKSPELLNLTWEPGAPPYLASGFVTLAGQKILVIADTASPFSYVYPSSELQRIVQLAGLPVQATAHSLTYSTLTLGNVTFSKLTLHTGGRYRKAGRDYPRALVLGADALLNHWLTWKASTHTLTISLQKPSFQGVALPCALVERQEAAPFWVLTGQLAGQPANFLIDTGNGSSFARLQGAQGSAPIPVNGIAPGGDTWNLSLYSSPPLQLGGLSWSTLPVMDEQNSYFAGRLGFSFFRGTDWCGFFGKTPTQGPEFWVTAPPEWQAAKNGSYGFGLGLYLIEGGWTVIVSEVVPSFSQRPALGSQVTAVNGIPATGANFPLIWEALQKPQLELSWIEGTSILTRTFHRTELATPEQNAL